MEAFWFLRKGLGRGGGVFEGGEVGDEVAEVFFRENLSHWRHGGDDFGFGFEVFALDAKEDAFDEEVEVLFVGGDEGSGHFFAIFEFYCGEGKLWGDGC